MPFRPSAPDQSLIDKEENKEALELLTVFSEGLKPEDKARLLMDGQREGIMIAHLPGLDVEPTVAANGDQQSQLQALMNLAQELGVSQAAVARVLLAL